MPEDADGGGSLTVTRRGPGPGPPPDRGTAGGVRVHPMMILSHWHGDRDGHGDPRAGWPRLAGPCRARAYLA
jgi:hypothetical protein